MTSLLSSLAGALGRILSLFNPYKKPPPSPARKRNYKRLNLQHLIKKYNKGSTQHSIYRKILAKRLSQQLKQSKRNSTYPLKSTNKTLHIKPKKKIHHKKPHKSAPIVYKHAKSTARSSSKKEPIPPIHHNIYDDVHTAYIIPRFTQEIYAPSAPQSTPPPSPRRGSLPDVNLAISYPPNTPTVSEFPHLLSEGFLFSPASPVPISPFPTAPPAIEVFPVAYPAPQVSPRFLQPTHPASPPFSSPLVRRHFAQYYIPQVKTSIPYVRPPPPDMSYSTFRPAPYAPTELDVQQNTQ